jgi:hypothetical protein
MDVDSYSGKYTGQLRGSKLTFDIGATDSGVTLTVDGSEDIDTITTYIGNNQWLDGNQILTFYDDHLTIDMISGFYFLQKEDE